MLDKKTLGIGGMILAVIIVVTILIVSIFLQMGPWKVDADPKHQMCQSDEDCVPIETECGGCEPSAVNKQYRSLYDLDCTGYTGVECNYEIFASYCNQGICTFGTSCGNGMCDSNENCSNCPYDCGECPIEPPDEESIIKIASWYLEGLNTSNETLMQYAGVVENFDIMVIQGIEMKSDFDELCDMMEGYECEVSRRMGRTDQKERYGVVYKNATKLRWSNDLQKQQELWEWPPFMMGFRVGGWNFTLLTIHINPEDTLQELQNLEDQLNYIPVNPSITYEFLVPYDFIIMGNLNADCDYYNRSENPTLVRSPSYNVRWTWAIPDDADTTLDYSDCAYDRIIYNTPAGNNFLEWGVYNITAGLSDHYPIWASFRIDMS